MSIVNTVTSKIDPNETQNSRINSVAVLNAYQAEKWHALGSCYHLQIVAQELKQGLAAREHQNRRLNLQHPFQE